MKLALQGFAVVLLFLTAACADVGTPSPVSELSTPKLAVDPSLLGPRPTKPNPIAETPPPVPMDPTPAVAIAIPLPLPIPIQPVEIQGEAGGIGIKVPSSARPSIASEPAAAPSVTERAKPAAPRLAVEAPAKIEVRPPVARIAESTLDLASLKARLTDTSAIGIFTKLALKNQVDDLMNKFRAHYESGQKTNVSTLRQPYNDLVAKLLALVQDSDPSLARTISGSREAIWGILADAEKFKAEI